MDLSLSGSIVNIDSLADKKTLLMATVADARGSDAETLGAVTKLREKFIKEKVNLVVSLGGIGEDKESIQAVLAELTRDAPYLLVAMPGDRESVTGHRQAIAELVASGARVLDGANYRLIRMGNLLLATMPGIAMTANLVAGDEGCEHTAEDVSRLQEQLANPKKTVVLASYAPPRAQGPQASDRGAGAIHTGETILSPLLRNEAVSVLVHGMVQEETPAPRGRIRPGQEVTSLAAGSLDPLEGQSAALLLSISGKKLSWRRIQAMP
jgi:hypothetical protein